MEFDFLQKNFPDCKVILKDVGCGTFAEVYASDETEPVKVFLEDIDHQPYTVCFSYQHVHCFNEEEAVEWTKSFLSGERSAIEFFIGDKPCVGGDIESIAPENFTTEYFKTCPFAQFILSKPIPENLNFKVRSVLKKFCFDGYFEKTAKNFTVIIDPLT